MYLRGRQPWRAGRGRALVAALALAVLPALAGVATSAAPAAGADASIAIYPTELTFSNALRGGEYFRTIGVINDSGVPVTFNLKATGPIASWAGFVDPTNLGQAVSSVVAQPRGQVGLRIRVPAKAANGSYQGVVQVRSTPVANVQATRNAANQSVSVGADIAVTVGVTGTQILRGTLLDSRAPNRIEAGYNLRLKNVVQNTGNVQLHPEFAVAIRRGAQTVALLNAPVDSSVAPGSTGTIEADWKTTPGTATGRYTARVVASAQGVALGARDVNFELVPFGTLRRNGRFESLKVVNRPKKGEAAHGEAVFRNTGEIETTVAFVGQLERGGHSVRGVTTVPVLVEPGDVRTIDVFAPVSSSGRYTLTGTLNFDGRQTNARSTAFRVPGSSTLLRFGLAVLAALVVTAILVFVLVRRRRRRTTSLDHRLARARHIETGPARTSPAAGAGRANAAQPGEQTRRHDRTTRTRSPRRRDGG